MDSVATAEGVGSGTSKKEELFLGKETDLDFPWIPDVQDSLGRGISDSQTFAEYLNTRSVSIASHQVDRENA